MFKKYDYRLVRSYQSYTIKEICRLYKHSNLHDKTIRSWIRSGSLDTIADGNRLLIYGALLKQFLKNRNSGKRTLGIKEFFCYRCKLINAPLENTIISVSIQNNGSILASGLCPSCAAEMKRLYKSSESKQIMELFDLEITALTVLSDIACTADNTHPQANQKLAKPESRLITLSCSTHDSASTNKFNLTKNGGSL